MSHFAKVSSSPVWNGRSGQTLPGPGKGDPRNPLFLLSALLILFLSSSHLLCQSTFSGDIAGTVTDPSGAMVANADIKAVERGTGATVTVKSSKSGAYRIPTLNPGIYVITVTATGFKPGSQVVVVAIGQVSDGNIVLGMSTVSQVVKVTAAPELLQTENGVIATTVTSDQIADIPNPGDDLTYVGQISPGAVMNSGSGGGVGSYSSFGLPATSNLNTINGENENDPWENTGRVGATDMLLGNNDIAEVTVVANGGAEYGALGGSQLTAVTKSGTNQVHGNARYGWNGRVLNANDYFNVRSDTPRPFDNVNQWAASLGGPLRKDKTFFFLDSEGTRIILPTSQLTIIPSPAFERLALSSVPSNQLSFYQQIFNTYNAAPGASRATPVAGDTDLLQFQSNLSAATNEWLLAGRIDQNLGANDRVFFHVRIDHGLQDSWIDPINSLFNADAQNPMYDGQLNENHTFSPNLINQFLATASYAGGFLGNNPKGLALFPGGINWGYNLPLTAYGGIQAFLPTGVNETQYSFTDNLAWTRRGHSLKFGIDFKRDDITDYQVSSGTLPYYAYELRSDFLAGNNSFFGQGFSRRPSEPLANYTLGFYAEDQWQARPNLAVTAGLRVEHFSNAICVTDCVSRLTSNFENLTTDPNTAYNAMIISGQRQVFSGYQAIQLQPHVGFAWSPFGTGSSTVLRGGFGMFSDYFPGSIFHDGLNNIPNVDGFSVQGGTLDPSTPGSAASLAILSNSAFAAGYNRGGNLASISQAVSNAGGTFTAPGFNNLSSNLKYPTYEQWNIGVQQRLRKTTAVTVQYVGNHGYHEYFSNGGLNAYNNPAVSGIHFAGFPAAPHNAAFLTVAEAESSAVSNYNGFVVSATNRGKYLTLQVNYAWSHVLDEISNGGNLGFRSSSIVSPVNPFNLRQVNYGSADYDVRHNLTAGYVFTVPSYHRFSALTDGWQLSGTVFANTGFPFSVIDSATSLPLEEEGYGGTVLADQLVPTNNISCGTRATSVPCLTSSQFGSATGFGSQRRNQLRQPGYFNTDFTVLKAIKFPHAERVKFQVGAQFFNIFNHPNFAAPNSDVATTTFFGLITSTVSSHSSLLGTNLGGDASPRMIQLTGRIKF
jgi:hypothetical protein